MNTASTIRAACLCAWENIPRWLRLWRRWNDGSCKTVNGQYAEFDRGRRYLTMTGGLRNAGKPRSFYMAGYAKMKYCHLGGWMLHRAHISTYHLNPLDGLNWTMGNKRVASAKKGSSVALDWLLLLRQGQFDRWLDGERQLQLFSASANVNQPVMRWAAEISRGCWPWSWYFSRSCSTCGVMRYKRSKWNGWEM